MDDALESNNRKQSARNSCSRNCYEDDQAKESSRVSPALTLEEELGGTALTSSSHGECNDCGDPSACRKSLYFSNGYACM